jgi:hypothetical protein
MCSQLLLCLCVCLCVCLRECEQVVLVRKRLCECGYECAHLICPHVHVSIVVCARGAQQPPQLPCERTQLRIREPLLCVRCVCECVRECVCEFGCEL